MHSYPADPKADRAALLQLIRDSDIKVVDPRHTHYNEFANDGRTIYATTRSTGQLEEGPVGFSGTVLDCGNVGWRFKPLHTRWPLLMITFPVDRRLATDPEPSLPRGSGTFEVHASAWGALGIRGHADRVDTDKVVGQCR